MFFDILNLISSVCTDVFVLGGLIGILFFVFGLEKAGKVPSICWLLNLLSKIIVGVLLGV